MEKLRIDYVRFGFGQNLPPLEESVKLKFEHDIHIAYKDLIAEIIGTGAYIQAHYGKDGKSITKVVPMKFPGSLLDKYDKINWKSY
jgi:hypothetical protein